MQFCHPKILYINIGDTWFILEDTIMSRIDSVETSNFMTGIRQGQGQIGGGAIAGYDQPVISCEGGPATKPDGIGGHFDSANLNFGN